MEISVMCDPVAAVIIKQTSNPTAIRVQRCMLYCVLICLSQEVPT